MNNKMTNYIPTTIYNGEDCLIIPLRQIIDISTNMSIDAVPEMEIRIRGEIKNGRVKYRT